MKNMFVQFKNVVTKVTGSRELHNDFLVELYLDSIDLIDITMEMEKQFNIKISSSDFERITSLSQLYGTMKSYSVIRILTDIVSDVSCDVNMREELKSWLNRISDNAVDFFVFYKTDTRNFLSCLKKYISADVVHDVKNQLYLLLNITDTS